MLDTERARDVLARHRDELFSRPYVSSVAVSVLDGQAVIVVLLSRRLRAGEWLPTYLEGVRLVARVTGDIQPLRSRTEKWRPAPAGVSVGHHLVTAGTLGILLYVGGAPFIVSNNHVLALFDDAQIGDEILQPGSADGGDVPDDVIAHLWHIFPVSTESPNTVDCALAEPVSAQAVEDRILGLRPHARLVEAVPGEAHVGMQAVKSGRTTGVTVGQVWSLDASVLIQGPHGLMVFEDLIAIEMAAAGGDSGSAVLSHDGRLLGLLSFGTDANVFACKIANIAAGLTEVPLFRPHGFAVNWMVPLLGLAVVAGGIIVGGRA